MEKKNKAIKERLEELLPARDELKFVNTKRIDRTDAQYRFLIGLRSNGKTSACLESSLKYCVKSGTQMAIIRRWDTDFKGDTSAKTCFNGLSDRGIITEITNGVWDGIKYYNGAWYFSRVDADTEKTVRNDIPIAYAFSINMEEHYKSGSWPRITRVVFDEVISRKGYLPDEFVSFCNILSTIIRTRDDVVIYMCANTINWDCLYFKEMGLGNIRDLKEGDLKVWQYGQSKLKVAVQYTDKLSQKGSPSDVYFAFGNPKLKMITGGDWEIALYPLLPCSSVHRNDILFTFYVKYEFDTLQGEVVQKDNNVFIFMHNKTTTLKEKQDDLIFSNEVRPEPNYVYDILRPTMKITKKIAALIAAGKIFYQSNTVGEVMNNYITACRRSRGF